MNKASTLKLNDIGLTGLIKDYPDTTPHVVIGSLCGIADKVLAIKYDGDTETIVFGGTFEGLSAYPTKDQDSALIKETKLALSGPIAEQIKAALPASFAFQVLTVRSAKSRTGGTHALKVIVAPTKGGADPLAPLRKAIDDVSVLNADKENKTPKGKAA